MRCLRSAGSTGVICSLQPMARTRDDFTANTIDVLTKRSGNCCSNPDCRRLIVGPSSNPEKAVIIGVAAHITAAAQGGPRYNDSLSSDERKHIANGIWLCATCSTLIDKDWQYYPTSLLLEWKTASELSIRKTLLSSSAFDFFEKSTLDWNTTATNVANFLHEHLFQAHRGALRYSDEVSLIFGNDGYETTGKFDANDEVLKLRQNLSEISILELGFGLCNDRYTWCLLVESNRTKFLNDLIWEVSPVGGSNNSIQHQAAYLALSTYTHSALGRYIK